MIDNNEPHVSVLVTVYNREKYLAECLDSILRSGYSNYEVIVVDDRSSDASVEIARSYARRDSRVQVHLNSVNLGDYPNRNRAASLANGSLLKYVDSDDMIQPDCLEKMVAAMNKHPDAAYAISYPRPVDRPRPLLLSPEEAYRLHMIEKLGFFCAGPLLAMIRTDRFREIGGFRPSARNMGDAILWMELSQRWPMLIVEDGLTFWRQHEGQEFGLVRCGGQENAKTHCLLTSIVLRDFLANPVCPLTEPHRRASRRKTHADNFRRVLWHLRHMRLNLACYELGWTLRSLAGLWPDSVPERNLPEA
jgi:cellulose synthase/poly-beta-1,6-N-acetylglucosamine synthase-like glycosyltransferase